MMEERNYYVADTVSPFTPTFTGRSLGFMKRCDLTRVNSLYTDKVNKMHFIQRGGG